MLQKTAALVLSHRRLLLLEESGVNTLGGDSSWAGFCGWHGLLTSPFKIAADHNGTHLPSNTCALSSWKIGLSSKLVTILQTRMGDLRRCLEGEKPQECWDRKERWARFYRWLPPTDNLPACRQAQFCLTLWDPTDCRPTGSSCPWNFPSKSTGVGGHFILQGIFPTQGSNTTSLASPALASRFFTTGATYKWKQTVLL